MHQQVLLSMLLVAAAGSAAEDAYRAEIEAWRASREARLKAEDGWLALGGLFWLKPGRNSFGSDPASDVPLPGAAPRRAGVFFVEAERVRVRLEPGVEARLAAGPGDAAELRPDSDDALSLGRFRLQLIERGGRLAIRLRDPQHPARLGFKGLSWFPVDPAYRVTARLVPHDPPRRLEIVNVLGQVSEMTSPGVAIFSVAGRELQLTPVLESPDADALFFIFRDRTSGRETYGAGRYLYAPLPTDGQVVLDFNKAYSPPCAFTDYATCPLPPAENRLGVRVEAGELAPAHEPHAGSSAVSSGETLPHSLGVRD